VEVEFVVQPSGEVSNVVLAKSSGYRACDQTVASSVKKLRGKKSVAPTKTSVILSPYTCPLR
jgi:TonB family protein